MHVTHVSTWVIVSAVAAAFFLFIPRRRDYLTRTLALTSRLTPERRAGLSKYITRDDLDGKEFWEDSHGVAGVSSRLMDMTVMLRILQGSVEEGVVKARDAREVKRWAILQLYYSLWAYPESLLCLLWRSNPHLCAAAALRFHWNVYLRTLTLCKVDGAPDCIFGLR